jgi:O-acetyl-ADP-ribose deacetylase (regulator of RNase III)
MRTEITIGQTRLVALRGDITEQDTDAIVNAANSSLLGGGGVDGAIHRAGGPRILDECKVIVEKIGRCPVGEAVITTGGNLRARFVVHTVGPVWRGGSHGESSHLESAYRNSLEVARSRGIRTIAFPSISTGAYRYPVAEAAEVALKAVADVVRKDPMEEVRFVLFSEDDFRMYSDALGRLL